MSSNRVILKTYQERRQKYPQNSDGLHTSKFKKIIACINYPSLSLHACMQWTIPIMGQFFIDRVTKSITTARMGIFN